MEEEGAMKEVLLSRIKYELTRMERVERITYIGYNVMNEDGI